MQACTFCHGRHARAAGGMNVDIRGDAQIGSTDCYPLHLLKADGKPVCLCQLNQDSQKFGGSLAVEESYLGINPTGQSLQIPFTALLNMLT